MLNDMAQIPPSTWGKYWPLMMKFLDWLADRECQVCIYDLHLLQWQQIAMLDCTYCALQKDGPDAGDPPDDTVPDEDDLDDCPLPDAGQVDQQSLRYRSR